MSRRSARGSILVEGLAGVTLLLLAACLNLEVVRRAWYEVTLHHAAFLFARSRALGGGEERSRRLVRRFLFRALGEAKARAVGRGLRLGEDVDSLGLVSRVHYRFPAFLRFPYDAAGRKPAWTKHHFEVTRRCRFRF